jgi:hypothetical protein
MVGLASALIAVLVIGVFVAAQLNRPPAGAAQAGVATPRPSPASAADQPSPAGFNCRGSTSLARGPAPALAYIDTVGVTEGAGYDRLTIQFTGGAPALSDLVTQDSATFSAGVAGQEVRLSGQAGAMLTLHGTDGHTRYGGQADLKTGSAVVLEIRKVEDVEGSVQWAVGLSRPGCYRMAFLDQPTRLVIDFEAGAGPS